MLLLILFIGGNSKAQVNATPINNQERTRDVYFFIIDLDNASEVAIIENHLSRYDKKIVSYSVDVTTQMCTLSVKEAQNEDLKEVIFQSGFKGILKTELPPSGFKYVYNPDGSWKLKEI